MGTNGSATRAAILAAGQEEFLKNGFSSASLRRIAACAGVTTGAFYGCFASKAALFDALVGEHAAACMAQFKAAQAQFAALPPEQQFDNLGKISGDCMDWMLDYVYAHPEAFKLIICCAQGTQYDRFIHEMVEIEVQSTHDFMQVLRGLGKDVPNVDPKLEHILVSGMFSAFFELVQHDMPKEQAVEYVRELRAFYTAGWLKIMGL